MDTLTQEPATVQREYCEWSDALATDIRDAVMVAFNRGYVENDLQASFVEAMRNHMSDCNAWYRTAIDIDKLLGFESAMGNRWGVKR